MSWFRNWFYCINMWVLCLFIVIWLVDIKKEDISWGFGRWQLLYILVVFYFEKKMKKVIFFYFLRIFIYMYKMFYIIVI